MQQRRRTCFVRVVGRVLLAGPKERECRDHRDHQKRRQDRQRVDPAAQQPPCQQNEPQGERAGKDRVDDRGLEVHPGSGNCQRRGEVDHYERRRERPENHVAEHSGAYENAVDGARFENLGDECTAARVAAEPGRVANGHDHDRDDDHVEDRAEGIAGRRRESRYGRAARRPASDADAEGEQNRRDGVLAESVADAGHRAHEPGLDGVDGVVVDRGAVGPLFLHGDDHAVDYVAEVGLGVEEDHVSLESGPDVVLGGVEAPDDRRHGVGEAGALQPLVVVVGVGEERPQDPRLEEVAAGHAAGGYCGGRRGGGGAVGGLGQPGQLAVVLDPGELIVHRRMLGKELASRVGDAKN